MNTEAARALAEQFNEAWLNHDTGKMGEPVSDDVLQQYPASIKTREGRNEVTHYLSFARTIGKADI